MFTFHKIFKIIMPVVAGALLVGACREEPKDLPGATTEGTETPAPDPKPDPQPEPDPVPADTLPGVEASVIAARITHGINIGNTLEAPPGETAWGNPMITREYVKGLKRLGFDAVRLPCAWDSHVSNAANNTIDPAWLARVDEVVGWILAEDMCCVLNIHWDGGWLEETCSDGYSAAVDRKLADYWKQIATKLEHHNERLLFAAMNEPGMQRGLSATAVDAIGRYQATFILAVRRTGGFNRGRCLVLQVPKAEIDAVAEWRYSVPADPGVKNRRMVEVHMYDPSDFTILSNDGDWWAGSKVRYYWGEKFHIPGSERNCTWGEEAHIDAQFKKIRNLFLPKGIPVIIGEYACQILSPTAAGIDYDRWRQSRAYWTEYVTRSALANKLLPFYWETGGDINRADGSAKNPEVISAIMSATK